MKAGSFSTKMGAVISIGNTGKAAANYCLFKPSGRLMVEETIIPANKYYP